MNLSHVSHFTWRKRAWPWVCRHPVALDRLFPLLLHSAPLSGLKAGRFEATVWVPLIFSPILCALSNAYCATQFFPADIFVCWTMSPISSSNHKAAFPVSVIKKLWPKVNYQRCPWQDHVTLHFYSKIRFLSTLYNDIVPMNLTWGSAICVQIPKHIVICSNFWPNYESLLTGNVLIHKQFDVSLVKKCMLGNKLPAVEISTPWSTSINWSN